MQPSGTTSEPAIEAVRLRAIRDLSAALNRVVDAAVADEVLALCALELALAMRLARLGHAGGGNLDPHVAAAVSNVDRMAKLEMRKLAE